MDNIDGDGRPDIIRMDDQYPQLLKVIKNNSTGGVINDQSLCPPAGFNGGNGIQFMTVCDIDGDGKMDIIFTPEELAQLDGLQLTFQERVRMLPEGIIRKERNRLSIELSWKSSQIEGKTYSLLETEVLLSENIPAGGKEKDEATMLLNHKKTLDYIYERRMVMADLGVSKNIRKSIVGITGTSYTPPDNEFQIREYLDLGCEVINHRPSIFEKSLLTVLFISYIQPFEDGNKRTGRITGNGILIENNYCPLSYRSVKPVDYKKAMILFYEQNNLAAYKKLFIEQFDFAVNNYFR